MGFRFIYFVVEYAIEELQWRFAVRERVYQSCLDLLRAHNFPNPSTIAHNNFPDFLRVMELPVTDCEESVRKVAKQNFEDWQLLASHLTPRQNKRYAEAMETASNNWFGEKWMKE